MTQRLRSLFLDVTKLRYDHPILFRPYGVFCRETRMTLAQLREQADLRDGCMLRRTRGGTTVSIVLYNEEQPNIRRRNFTLAHEIGHIYLGHEEDATEEETEANMFASELLMPTGLVWELFRRTRGVLSPDDLCQVFAVSRQAAANRLRGMGKQYRPSPLDKAIVNHLGRLLPNIDGPVIDL